MPFTVEDFQDLLRLLDQHPEWRAELRRQVLTDELLELPALVRSIGQHVERLANDIETLAVAQQRTESRLGRAEGTVLELRYARNGPAYLSRLARRLRLVDAGLLADMLDDAIDAGQMTDMDRLQVLQADLVFSGRRREDQADIYILAEVSSGIRPYDVERAADRAAILSKLGRDVVPVVVGYQINSEALDLARERGVAQFLDEQSL